MLDRAASRSIDRVALEKYGLPGIVLMENAASGLLRAARHALTSRGVAISGSRVLVVCGGGNNGGDGYALARRLHNDGAAVTLAPLAAPKPGTDAAVNHAACRAMNLIVATLDDALGVDSFDLVVDAIFGTGLDRPPDAATAEVIDRLNAARPDILAVDLPSGLDCDTGAPLGACIRATWTVTFAAMKKGFANPSSRAFTCDVIVADIGVPRELVEACAAGTA
jgi:hydroxyethylthiazole kinase-like uncharacterized protein yjeF